MKPPTTVARLLALVLCAGILSMWIEARWAYATVQLALFALAALHLAGDGRVRSPVVHWMAVVPAGAVVIGLVQLATGRTIYAWQTRTATLDWFTWLAVFWLTYRVLDGPGALERFLHGVLVFSMSVATVALLLRFTEIRGGVPVGRMGPFVYENQYANFVEMTLPLALLAATTAGLRQWRYTVLAAVMIGSVLVSGSVAGTALVAVESAAVLGVVGLRTGNFRPLAGVAALVAVLAAVTGLGLLSLDLARENPLGFRERLTISSIEMTLDRPWTGFGLGTWSTAYPAYSDFDDGLFDNQAHNDWAQWAVEGGLPLFLLMLALAAGLARPAFRQIWGVGLLCVLVHALIDYPFQQRPALACFYFALAAALLRAGQR